MKTKKQWTITQLHAAMNTDLSKCDNVTPFERSMIKAINIIGIQNKIKEILEHRKLTSREREIANIFA